MASVNALKLGDELRAGSIYPPTARAASIFAKPPLK
jgi:hypothetical protein